MSALTYAKRVTRLLSNRVSGKVSESTASTQDSLRGASGFNGRSRTYTASDDFGFDGGRISSVSFGEMDDDIIMDKEASDVVWCNSEIDMEKAWQQSCLEAKCRTLCGVIDQDPRAARRANLLSEIGKVRVSK